MTKPITLFIGCDVGDKFSHICVLNLRGKVVEQLRLKTGKNAFQKWFGQIVRARVVIEVGAHSRWINEVLVALGHEVVVANARQVQLIYRRKRKTDRSDAVLLARLGRVDPQLLCPVVHRSGKSHAALAMLRSRDVLVRSRTRLVNHVRGMLKPFGVAVSGCAMTRFATEANDVLPAELGPALTPIIEAIQSITASIQAYEHQLEACAREEYPEAIHLQQIPGVGLITSLAFLLIIDDPARFTRSRVVGAFFGLTCGKDQSGDADPEKRITKCGDPFVRRLLVQCAQHILCKAPDSDLKRWGLMLAARGKKAAKKRAIVAVARKLAVLMHRLWVTGEQYQPLGYHAGYEKAA